MAVEREGLYVTVFSTRRVWDGDAYEIVHDTIIYNGRWSDYEYLHRYTM